jgi:hypothetical protein
MQRTSIAGLFVAFAAAFVACSDRSPAAPSTTDVIQSSAMAIGIDAPTAQAPHGLYTLNFAKNSGQIVSTLPVGDELILWAQVRDSSGVLATRGARAILKI